MVETGDDGPDRAERLAATAEARKAAWQRTLDEMQALADRRREEGREAVVVPAGDTGMASTDEDDVRLSFVIPGNKADEVTRLVTDHPLDQYDVYRQTVEQQVYLVVEYFDPDGPALFVAGAYELRNAGNVLNAIDTADPEFYTHLRKLDRTPVATFHHADRSKFVPEEELPGTA